MGEKILHLPGQEQRIKLLELEIQELREALLQLERRQRFPTFLSIKELTEMLPVSERTVYDWVSRGLIPYHKAGDRTLFLLDEILKWTKRHGNDIQTRM
jgi:excisionase family DNA binding protein